MEKKAIEKRIYRLRRIFNELIIAVAICLFFFIAYGILGFVLMDHTLAIASMIQALFFCLFSFVLLIVDRRRENLEFKYLLKKEK